VSTDEDLRDSVVRIRTSRLGAWYAAANRIALALARGDGLASIHEFSSLSDSTIRRWAFAARRIQAAELSFLEAWRDDRGRHLAPCHLVELARFSRSERDNLLRAMREGVWPVAKLRRHRTSTKLPT
jgi:hypothetical protein